MPETIVIMASFGVLAYVKTGAIPACILLPGQGETDIDSHWGMSPYNLRWVLWQEELSCGSYNMSSEGLSPNVKNQLCCLRHSAQWWGSGPASLLGFSWNSPFLPLLPNHSWLFSSPVALPSGRCVYFQLCIFDHPPSTQNAANPFRLAKYVDFLEKTPEILTSPV